MDHLRALIKSMSKNEKGYFKKYIRVSEEGSDDKIYYILFDYLEKNIHSSDKEIKEHFSQEKFAKQLPVYKNYLIKQILKCLRNYFSEANPFIRVHNKIIDLEILMQKSLNSHAREEINHLKDTFVKKYELYRYVPELARIERNLIVHSQYKDKIRKQFEDTFRWENEAHKLTENASTIHRLANEISEICYKRPVRNARTSGLLKRKLQNPYLSDPSLALTTSSRYNQFFAFATFYFFNNEMLKAAVCLKKITELLENNPGYHELFPSTYISMSNNYLLACGHLRLEKEVIETISKTEKHLSNLSNSYFDTFVRTLINVTKSLIDIGEYDMALDKLSELDVLAKKNEDNFTEDRIKEIHYRYMQVYIATNDFNKAWARSNEIISSRKFSSYREYYSISLILHLFILWELNKKDVLLSALRSAEYYFKKNDKLGPFETATLKFFRSLLVSDSRKETDKLFLNFHQGIKPVFSSRKPDPFVLYYFDFLSYLEAKTSHTSMKEIVKKKCEEASRRK